MQSIVLFAVVAFQAIAASQGCPSLDVVTPLDVTRFLGTWYQQESKNTFFFQGPGSCVKAEYGLDATTNQVTVHNSQKVPIFGEVSISGFAELVDTTTKKGILKVTLNTPVGPQTADLSVLATDYDNFAILYSCRQVFFLPITSAWILTREQKLEGDEKTAVYKLIDDAFAEINKVKDTPKHDEFKKTDQSNC